MARASITNSGLGVKLTLTFREAAALRALLARVGAETDEAINEATLGTFFQLDDLVNQCGGQWPEEFDYFVTAGDGGALVQVYTTDDEPEVEDDGYITAYPKSGG
jgi:hypothetical protein